MLRKCSISTLSEATITHEVKMKKILAAFLIIATLVSVACSEVNEKYETEKLIPIKTVSVKKEIVSIPIITSGRLASTSELKLSFKTPGIVEKIFVKEGISVNKGDLLATLDLTEIKSQLTQAESGYTKAKRDYARVEKLYADSVVTLEQLQNMETMLTMAKSQMEIARFNFQHSEIIAPTTGTILKKFVEEKELVSPGHPIFIFGDKSDGWILNVGITDKDIVKLKLGDKATIEVDPYPNESFDAIVTQIGEAASPINGTYDVELSINKTNHKLVSGFVAKALLFPSHKEEYFVLPIEAITEAHGNKGVIYTVDSQSQTAKSIQIVIKSILKNSVMIKSGLEDVESVIVDGVEYLSNGAKVKIIKN